MSYADQATPPAHALFRAIDDRDESKVRALVEAGADLNGEEDGYTPLMYALGMGRIPLAEVLVRLGADLNRAARSGYGDISTPLMCAVSLGNIPMVRLLIEHGADLNRAVCVDEQEALTPLIRAVTAGWRPLTRVKALIALGADVNLDVGGRTALHEAKQTEMVEALLAAGAQPRELTGDESVDVACVLLDHGALLTAHAGKPLLGRALGARSLPLLMRLLERGPVEVASVDAVMEAGDRSELWRDVDRLLRKIARLNRPLLNRLHSQDDPLRTIVEDILRVSTQTPEQVLATHEEWSSCFMESASAPLGAR